MPDGTEIIPQICDYSEIKIGCSHNGKFVKKIYAATDSYSIFSVEEKATGLFSSPRLRCPEYDIVCEQRKNLRAQLAPLAGSIARVYDVLDAADAKRERTFEIIARAYDMALQDVDVDSNRSHAIDLLSRHLTALEERRDSENKMKYVIANAIALAFFLTLWGAIAWINTANAQAGSWAAVLYGHLEGPMGVLTYGLAEPGSAPNFTVMDVLALGAIGAFFSVSMGIRSLKIPTNITNKEMIWTGLVRVTVGIIAAAVVIPLIAGRWILGSVSAEYLGWSFLVFGFLAGFSEMFVPNTLKQVEASGGKSDNSRPSDSAARAKR